MKHLLKIGQVNWIHFQNPTKDELVGIGDEYDLHEIIIDDIIEQTTQDKVDTYDNHIFMVLHFPKYDYSNKRYKSNEFSFILGKNFIITITSLPSNNIEKIKEEYINETNELEDPEKYKISPYYILYKIIDTMYDKTLDILGKSNKDIMNLEEGIFDQNGVNKKLLEEIMVKKRNLVFLKHNFIFQGELLTEMQKIIEKFYEGQLDLYFEDIIYKLDKIDNNITVLSKNVTSLTDVYNSLMSIKINSILARLTVFTLIIGTLTFIVGIYGMNVKLPMQEWSSAFYIIVILMIVLSFSLGLVFKKRGWFE
ncbi:MAG: magnesium transporter CorA family protein [Candidatus Gracilibacteria bacterium]|nr:magnesium transporter CorA family protein [Candidatus Gracilibacteria bacterium]